MHSIFDSLAETYDAWYDTPEGAAIFRAERDCLLSLCAGPFDTWLEVGTGTGRFASALGIPLGVDPSPTMLSIAAVRGIEAHLGDAEHLPFPEHTVDGVLMALTLCFVADVPRALRECHRVIRPAGSLLLGIVPAGSAWGLEYRKKAASGHPIYQHARFWTAREIIELAQSSGFIPRTAAGTLYWQPDQCPEQEPRIQSGCDEEAGFLALLFQNSGGKRPSAMAKS